MFLFSPYGPFAHPSIMEGTSYLLLGEGDFTYSLDLCRYIASKSHQVAVDNGEPTTYSITCTGVDTLDELSSKYRDADFVLRNIRMFSENTNNANKSSPTIKLKTKILHGINAVQTQEASSNGQQATLQHFDHVMFHHPHLGEEDALLHSRFLHHLFYAMNKRWLKHGVSVSELNSNDNKHNVDSSNPARGGLLYLTLVIGQCRRWKCIEAAKKQGLVLLRRGPFCPPPPPIEDTSSSAERSTNITYYQLRRHQSGKSFAKRRRMQPQPSNQIKDCNGSIEHENDSETLVFGRSCEYLHLASISKNSSTPNSIGMLPWEMSTDSASMVSDDLKQYEIGRSNYNKCSYCDKSFREERSLKNHMLNVHHGCKEVLAWATKNGKKGKKRVNTDISVENYSRQLNDLPFICSMCEEDRQTNPSSNDIGRVFPHMQALLDHQRAKHFGSHSNIKPDWYTKNDNLAKTKQSSAHHVENADEIYACLVCDASYFTDAERIHHELEFLPFQRIPQGEHVTAEKLQQKHHKCRYCDKSFREVRAMQQHENFCSTRNILSEDKP